MNNNNSITMKRAAKNIYVDLGFVDPELEAVKSAMVSRIAEVIDDRELTQVEAAKILGLDQPKVSALLRGKFGGYSIDRLLKFLLALDQDVQVVLKSMPERAKRKATLKIIAA